MLNVYFLSMANNAMPMLLKKRKGPIPSANDVSPRLIPYEEFVESTRLPSCDFAAETIR